MLVVIIFIINDVISLLFDRPVGWQFMYLLSYWEMQCLMCKFINPCCLLKAPCL